jgi:hypothetical protein
VVSTEAYKTWVARQKKLIAAAERLRSQQAEQLRQDGRL